MSAVATTADDARVRQAWQVLGQVADPEIPVVSVVDLGIVRDVRPAGGDVVVSIVPTYSGCPATEVIERDILAALRDNGFPGAAVETLLSPPWTTDWISERGRDRLRAYGIAPPAGSASLRRMQEPDLPAACPRCAALDTTRISEFGSTPCKAAWRCNACLEPFEQFKCI